MPTNNPLLTELKGLPGIVVSLPTGGAFYPPGTFGEGTNPAEIEVKPISILDEMNFRDPFKVVNGTAVSEMIIRSCPVIRNTRFLCKVDVDLIMIAARAASHGPIFESKITCTNAEAKKIVDGAERTEFCGAQSDVKLDLNRIIIQFGSVGSTDDWIVTLPNGQFVQLMPVPYATVVEGMQMASAQAKSAKRLQLEKKENDVDAIEQVNKEVYDRIAKLQVKIMVDSVCYVSSPKMKERIYDREMIYEWMASLPTEWIGKISDVVNAKAKMMESFTKASFTCPSCQKTQDFDMSLDPTSFFSNGSRNSIPLSS